MTISDKDKAILRYLTYPVQFSRPMKIGIERVFHTLIDPSIPFQSTAEFLKQIEVLRGSDQPLAGEVTTTNGHSESEIREFLELLAKEIEIRYPKILRSGMAVTRPGVWFQVDQPENRKEFYLGEILPSFDERTIVWEYQCPEMFMQADTAIKLELTTYYKKSVINGRPQYEGGEKYAHASASRLQRQLTSLELKNASTLLKQLSFDLDSALMKEIQALTDVKWLEDEIYRAWLQDVFHQIHLCFERISS